MDDEKKSYQFLDRVYVNAPRSKRGLRIFFTVVGVLLLLIGLFQCMMEGFSLKNIWPYGLGPLILYFYVLKPSLGSGGYKASPVSIDFGQNAMKITYPGIDREDGMGKRTEIFDIANNDVQRLEYNKTNQCIQIFSKPVLSVQFQDPKKNPIVNDFRLNTTIYESTLFPPDNVREELISRLETVFGKTAASIG